MTGNKINICKQKMFGKAEESKQKAVHKQMMRLYSYKISYVDAETLCTMQLFFFTFSPRNSIGSGTIEGPAISIEKVSMDRLATLSFHYLYVV